MAKVTRHDDAASIVDPELADELEERAKEELVGKSATEATGALVIKADGDDPVMDDEPIGGGVAQPDEPDVKLFGMEVDEWKPFGGATSLAEADDFMKAQELEWEVQDNWSMLRAIMDNILNNDEEGFDTLGAVRKAVAEFGDRVAALKANISDAYLLQPAIIKGATIMSDIQEPTPVVEPAAEGTQQDTAPLTPGQAFWASIETAAADPTKGRE